MDDTLGPIEVEFLINNPQIVADAKKAQETLTGVSDAVQAQCEAATTAINQTIKNSTTYSTLELNAITAQIKSVQTQLHDTQLRLGGGAFGDDEAVMIKKINELKTSLIDLRHQQEDLVTPINAEFKELGNTVEEAAPKLTKFQAAVERATNLNTIAGRVVQMFSRQIIGLATAFLSMAIGAKALEVLGQALANVFDILKGGESAAKINVELAQKANDLYAGQAVNVRLLVTELQNSNTSQLRQKEILSELNTISPTYFGNLKDIHDIVSKLPDDYAKYNKALLLNSQIEAGKSLITEKYKTLLEAQRKLLDLNGKAVGKDFASQFAQTLHDMANVAGTIDLSKNVAKNGLSGITDPAAKALSAQIKNSQRAIDQLSGNVINDQIKLQKNGGDIAGKGIELIKKTASNTIEVQKIALQNSLDFENSIFENHKKTLKERQVALKSALDQQLQIADLNQKQQLLNINLSESDKEVIIAKSNSEKLKATDEYNKKLGNLNKAAGKQAESEAQKQAKIDAEFLKRKQALLSEAANAEEEFNRKALTQDEAALKAISDKYESLRAKFAAFNADKKNVNNKIGEADFANINTAEKTDTANQINLNQNRHIQQDIDKKKKLYADYEAYKIKLGGYAANQEYADLLKSGKDFQTYLGNIEKSIPANDTSGPMQQRRELVAKQQADDLVRQKEQLDKLLVGFKSYEAERNVLTNTYDANRERLITSGHLNEVAQLDAQYKADLGRLDDANFEKITAVKELLKGVSDLSTQQAKTVINSVVADLANATGLTEEEIKKIKKALAAAQQSINDAAPQLVIQAGQGLQQIGRDIATVNAAFGRTISSIGGVVVAIGQMAIAYEAFVAAEKAANMAAEISSIIGLIVIAIELIVEAIVSVFTLFSAAHKSAVQAAADMAAYQDSLISGQIKYNELLRDQQRTQTDISKLDLQQLDVQKQQLALQTQQAQADYNTLLQKIQATGQQVTGEHTEKYGGFLGIAKKTKVVQDIAGLSGADYNNLLQLYTEGKLTDTTKAWFEQLQTVKKEMDDIGTSAGSVLDAINQAATGTTADAISTAIINGFKAGKRTAADFAGDFQSLMQNAALSVFQSNYLSGKIKDFYQQFADASNSPGGLTAAKIAQLKSAYGTIINNAGAELTNLEKVIGTSVTTPTTTSGGSGISGSVTGVTEPQANALEGALRGIQLYVGQIVAQLAPNSQTMESQLAEMQRQTLLQMQIAANTKRTADNTDTLPDMRDSLKNIDKNTADTNISVLRGAGLIHI